MWRGLPYRHQIPLGLSLAVLVSAAFVTLLSALFAADSARTDTLARVGRAATLLDAQGLPLLAADDTFRAFTLMRDTAGLLPGAEAGASRAALLDAAGRVFASSVPQRLRLGDAVLGALHDGDAALPPTVPQRQWFDAPDGRVRLVDPIRSEDGQLLGYGFFEVDAAVFAPDWPALVRPALLGAVLAVTLLAPIGWTVGQRMARPVTEIARAIETLGHAPAGAARVPLPSPGDAELGRIAAAVQRLGEEIDERRRAERRALSAERLAAVGRLTGAMAHEINNPLGGLINAVQTLRLRGADEAVRERALDLLARGLQQIRTTVAALLPQARVEDRALAAADLDDVLLLAQSATPRAGVEVGARAEVIAPPRVPSAPVRQVMLNLLLNAIKAAGDGGRVQALLQVDGERVRFCVSNTGAALSASRLARLVAAEHGDDPRGFGLWVCREIAALHGGGFDVDAAERAGTRLVFWIPNTPGHA